MSEWYQDWYEVERFADGGTMIAEPLHSEDVKSYLVEGREAVAVLDTGMGVGDFVGLVAQLSDRPPIVLQTHAHFDHIGASGAFSRVMVHPSEAAEPAAGYPSDRFRRWLEPDHLSGPLPAGFNAAQAEIPGVGWAAPLVAGDLLDLGGRTIEVFHTPGHSPGGLTFLDRDAKIMFPGDAVYEGPMFAYRPGSDPRDYRVTLQTLAELSSIVDRVYPSHNRSPLEPADVVAMHEAYEAVWAGRAPDERHSDHDVFDFGTFSFWLMPGMYGDKGG